ncbi:MAG: signal peptidase I [Firmicutes bacterium HGW-Firmicutes-3]|jgi:signal peptidase I|nr:MAG: signal peptidase I [Firmicutes bacterium HGW-Firmicutes-3]
MRKKLHLNEKVYKEIISWIKTIGLTLVIVLVINKGIIVNAYIPTSSMEETIMTGDRVIAARLAYITSEPERGDIVVFKNPDDKSILYVKRIIGLPGEEVIIKDENIYINGVLLEEEYILEAIRGEFGPYTVPNSKYFMLGDNRNGSKDSRVWNNTYLEKEDIIGKVIFRYFPNLKNYN